MDLLTLIGLLVAVFIIGFCAGVPSGRGVIVKPRPPGPRPKPAPIAPTALNKQAITADTDLKGEMNVYQRPDCWWVWKTPRETILLWIVDGFITEAASTTGWWCSQ